MLNMYNKADLKDKNTRCKHSLLKIRYTQEFLLEILFFPREYKLQNFSVL